MCCCCYHYYYYFHIGCVLIEYPDFQVEQVPLPLLFMRTVIQAIDAFPSLVPVNSSVFFYSISLLDLILYLLL